MEVLSSFLWESLDFGTWYAAHAWVADGLIYLVFFLGAARVTVGSRFEEASGRGAAAISAALGVALAVSATLLGRRTGFMLADLGPVAWTILLLLIGLVIYEPLRRIIKSRILSIGATFVIVSLTVASVGRPFQELLEAINLGWLSGLLGVAGITLLIGWSLLHGVHRQHHWDQIPLHHSSTDPSREPNERTDPYPSDATTNGTIRALRESLADHGINARSEYLLHQLANTKRAVKLRYEQAIRELARRGWRAETGKWSLDEGVKETLSACRHNIAQYQETLRIAVAGHDANNAHIVIEAIDRLAHIEKQARNLCRVLDAFLSKLCAAHGVAQ